MAGPSLVVGRSPGEATVLELEDVRLARVAQKRHAIDGATMARVFDRLEATNGTCLVEALRDLGAIDREQAARLLELRQRDVKPSNVLVSEGGARLIDFGLACRPGTASTGMAIGTPGYMSPEMARGEPASFATDVYSFGAMLYFALTAHYAFSVDTAE